MKSYKYILHIDTMYMHIFLFLTIISLLYAYSDVKVSCVDAGECVLCSNDEMSEDYCKETGKKMKVTCKGYPKSDDYRPCNLTAADEQLRRGQAADGADGAWPVLDNDVLAQRLAQLGRDQASHGIRSSARGISHHHRDRLGGKRLLGNCSACGNSCESRKRGGSGKRVKTEIGRASCRERVSSPV